MSRTISLVVGMVCAAMAPAATLDVRVVSTGNTATANAGPSVAVYVQARLDGGAAPTSLGLALIGFNLDVIPGGGAADADLCDTSGFLLLAPVGMANFDRLANPGPGYSNFGLTNPSASPNLSGYSGTCDGAGKLLQLGGGQNTIGNTPGGAPYPIGIAVTGVGNGGWVTVAEGYMDASSLTPGTQWTLSVDTVFATTIDVGQAAVPYMVTAATVGTLTGLQITGSNIPCPAWDVNCDGLVSAGDLLIITGSLNWQRTGPSCARADVNGDGSATAGDLLMITSSVRWQTSHGPCICTPNPTPGVGGCPV